MEVKDSTPVNNNHCIEWGYATWSKDEENDEDKDFSIRNRYNRADGGFNQAGSAEVPWSDFNSMILESIKRQRFSKNELSSILKEIANTLK